MKNEMIDITENVKNTKSNNNIVDCYEEEIIDKEEIIRNYLIKINFSFKKIEIWKLNEGLSNEIFFVCVDKKKKIFLKIFKNKIDRVFEDKIIKLVSSMGECAKILESDCKKYRIEEFIENISRISSEDLLTGEFLKILGQKIVKFNSLILYNPEDYKNKNIFLILKNVFFNSQEKFAEFKNKFKIWRERKKDLYYNSIEIHDNKLNLNSCVNVENKIISESFKMENLEKIELYLQDWKFEEILITIFPLDFIEEINSSYKNKKSEKNFQDEKFYSNFLTDKFPVILSHNDIHVSNLIYLKNQEKNFNEKIKFKFTPENILLIDYEYGCFNILGFDIVNFFIECMFNLDKPEYPFYSMFCKTTKIIYEKIYYNKYLEFFELFVQENPRFNLEILKSEIYYRKICRFASIFWFYTALQFLDFESNINRLGFNYVDYAVDRLSVYENFPDC